MKTTFTIQAIPAQHYVTPAATMISVAFGSLPIVRAVHDDYKTLQSVFDSLYRQAIESGAKCFSMRVTVNGRKPRGYDANAHLFRKDYVAPDAVPYM